MLRYLYLSLMCVSAAQAEEIPLKSIHALDAPYASDIRDLEPRYLQSTIKGSKITRILHAIRKMESAGPALIVSGEPLSSVHDILVDGKEPGPLPTKGLTLVFYALPRSPYLAIDSVTVKGNRITVKYHFISSANAGINETLAFIPLPELAKGKAEVEIIQLPLKKGRFASSKPLPAEAVERIICKPVQVTVE